MSSGLRLVAAVAFLGLAGLSAVAAADQAEIDYAFMPVPRGEDVRPMPKYRFGFGSPARWPGPLRWRYNGAGAPTPFADPDVAVAHLRRAFDGWSAFCGITHVYEGETTTPPNRRTTIDGRQRPDYENVVGWGALSGQTTGLTYTWYTPGADLLDLVDADVILSPTMVTNALSMERTARHEWGHALGLAHSDQPGMLMSGPPETAYNTVRVPGYDDWRGCRCLYGPAQARQDGYSCSLASSVDLGLVPIGELSASREVALRNDGNGMLWIEERGIGSREVVANEGCAPGTQLRPGETCVMRLAAVATESGAKTTSLSLETSDGPYRVAIRYEGSASPGPVVADLVEYFHAGFAHYFVTALPNEIAILDGGSLPGWSRTGKTMRVWSSPQPASSPACRFFSTRFDPKSSHFYTAFPGECADVKANADWRFEGEVFHVALPDAQGTCPAGTQPIYRLYNRGAGGAPNHRFTTDAAIRSGMLAQGWQAEGAGPGVTMCAP